MKSSIFVLLISFIFFNQAHSQTQKLSFADAKHKKLIEFRGKVQFQNNKRKLCLKMKNRSSDTLRIQLECGRTFMPENDTYQPLVVIRSKEIVLFPKENRDVYVNAICGNAPKSSAQNNSTEFNNYTSGNEKLTEVLKFMNQKRWDKYSNVQHIIWYFTNNHELASIYPGEMKEDEYNQLMSFICAIQKTEKPWYNIYYKAPAQNSRQLFTDQPEKIEATLEYILPENSDVQIVLSNPKGEKVKLIRYIINQDAGEYKMPLSFKVSDLARGNYEVRIETGNNKLLKSQSIKV